MGKIYRYCSKCGEKTEHTQSNYRTGLAILFALLALYLKEVHILLFLIGLAASVYFLVQQLVKAKLKCKYCGTVFKK